MENEFDSIEKRGFSHRSQDPDFIEAMKKQVGKNFKYAMIAVPIIFVVVLVIAGILFAIQGTEMTALIPTAFVLLVIFIGIAIGVSISFFRDRSNLKKDSIDGIVETAKKWRTIKTENKPRKTKYLITIRTDNGKKIKVKDGKAMMFYSYISEGDKVRYHPGYPFPIEMYDKSKNNVCVFCGRPNDASADKCIACGNDMLK